MEMREREKKKNKGEERESWSNFVTGPGRSKLSRNAADRKKARPAV